MFIFNEFRAYDKETDRLFWVARYDFADNIVFSHLFACNGYLGENLEIMQYTGLKDKNGVKIFEGDVISYAGMKFTVVRNEESFGWYEGDDYIAFTNMARSEFIHFEVVGNIYKRNEMGIKL